MSNEQRFRRVSTGVVHAGQVVTEPIREFTSQGWVETGDFRPRIVLACGWDPNTLGSSFAALIESEPYAAVTCAKCAKKIG